VLAGPEPINRDDVDYNKLDFAVLACDGDDGSTFPAPLILEGDAEKVTVGRPIFTIGCPAADGARVRALAHALPSPSMDSSPRRWLLERNEARSTSVTKKLRVAVEPPPTIPSGSATTWPVVDVEGRRRPGR
jgi:hypothetical protein